MASILLIIRIITCRAFIPALLCWAASAILIAHLGKHHRITRCIRSKIDM